MTLPLELQGLAEALRALPDVESGPCTGADHQLDVTPDRCVHLVIRKTSPVREDFLAQLAPLVRRHQFVLSALVERLDCYGLAWRPVRRGSEMAADAAALAQALADPAAWSSTHVPDRRGR